MKSPHADRLSKVKRSHIDNDHAAQDMVPVRVSIDEIMYLNYMQGGQFIDEDTHLREYSKLLNIIKNPEVRDIFIQIFDATKQPNKEMAEKLDEMSDQIEQDADIHQYYEEIPSDVDPEIQKIESFGEGDDKKLALMPRQLVGFLDVIKGSTETDPEMGLQEFNFFHEAIRAVSTIGGAILGGPVGAAVGNFAGKVATGANPRDNIIPAAKVGLATWGAGQLAGMAGSAFPGLASSAPGVFGANPGWATMPAWASSMMPGMGGVTPAGATTAGTTAASSVAPAAAAASSNPSTWSSALSSAGSWLGPAAMIGGGMYMNDRAEKAKVKAMQQQADRDRAREEELRKRYGFDEPLGVSLEGSSGSAAETGIRGREAYRHKMHEIRSRYKTGGHLGRPIVGKGKGQEDLIKDDRVKEGGWIWDATTTAHFGDGSTKAGQDELSKLEKFIAKHAGNLKKYQKLDHGGSPQKVPCALSDGERYTPPEVVTAAGHGSNEEGAAKFRMMTKALRKHKIAHGEELPPPAPDVIKLFKKVG